MKNLGIVGGLGLLFCSVLPSHAAPVQALSTALAPPAPANAEETPQWRWLKVKNVLPSTMAWWLDPEHSPEPLIVKVSKLSSQAGRMPVTPPVRDFLAKATPFALPKGYQLPAGTQQLMAIDPQQILRVFGTEAGTQDLQKLVEVLDKPLRQVEITARFVQIDPQDLAALGNDGLKLPPLTNIETNGTTQYRLSENFETALQQLIEQKKALVLMAPRVIAINKLNACLQTINQTPVEIGFKTSPNDKDYQQVIIPEDEGQFYLSRGTGFSATPLINIDGTVTVLATAFATQGLQKTVVDDKNATNLAGAEVKFKNWDGLQALIHFQGSSTVAVAGLTTHFFEQSNVEKQFLPDIGNVLLIVTARIVTPTP